MAVNSYNPRLFSSSSSENEVDEVFRRKGASVAPAGGGLPAAKNRCFSEPVYQSGKEAMKEDSKHLGKASALSDSSNVLTRPRGRFASQNGHENGETKNENFTIFEEPSPANVDKDKSTDSVFPEPESSREATKDAYRFSILLEEDESMDEMNPNLDPGQELRDEFTGELNNDGMRLDENEVYYMRDVAFGSTDEDAVVHADDQQNEDYDDDSYPEKEHIPSGYISYATQDLPYVPCSWDVPRSVLRSYSELELPDDLIKETGVYPGGLENVFGNISPALVPSSPFFAPTDCELLMKRLFNE